MRPHKLLIAALLLGAAAAGPAQAQLSVRMGLPSVSIGIHLGGYPDFVSVPGYPVYYAPRSDQNVFFYDGLYWVLVDDQWYASDWFDGPWDAVDSYAVPVFVLRVRVRYYRRPPPYFRGWQSDLAPRWGDHWGNSWSQRRRGWDQWDRRSVPAAAPLPRYQREYNGSRYPTAERQRQLRQQNYQYRPREDASRQRFQRTAPMPAAPRARPQDAPARAPAQRA